MTKTNGVEVLKVLCSSCAKGKVTVLELVNDNYKLGCTKCDGIEWMHYTGYDSMYEQHEYLSQISDDVKVLTSNGTWQCMHERQFADKSFNLKEFASDKKLIHVINSYGVDYFYRNGLQFFKVEENKVHDTYRVFKYVANANSILTLMRHF